jgi:hypothetical protein
MEDFFGYIPGEPGQFWFKGTQEQWGAFKKSEGLTEGVNPAPPPKRPLKKWAFRFALRNHTTLVEQIIAGVSDPVQKAAIQAKWDHGDTFHFGHADTQTMLAAILSVDPTFDADAIWATGEAAEYGT